jgi:hypothetical protein
VPVPLKLHCEERGLLRVHCAETFRQWGVEAFVTDRFGGVSVGPYESLNLGLHVGDDPVDVAENRERVARAVGIRADHLIFVDQVHGARIVDAQVGTSIEKADGLFSARSDLALAIMVADCVPILLVDPDSADFAVVHAGWRGLKGEVLSNALERFTEPSSVRALLGPSISARRYQVGPEVAEYFRDLPGAVHADQGDRSLLDLRTVATLLLVGLGLRDEHVSVCEESTDETTTFYSARAQQPCGRFALVARRSS